MNTRKIQVPKELYRSGTAEMSEDGAIRLSISSDEPYLRYDWMRDEEYYEVLDHGPNGMDAQRLNAGAPLLFNHDRNVQLGTLCNPEMIGGKCYVTAKLSEAPDVESYRVRIREGILKDTSVGYSIEAEGEEIGEREGIPMIKFRWYPHEASMVTIPADITVGLGRDIADRGAAEKPELKEIFVKCEKAVDEDSKRVLNINTPKASMADSTTPQVVTVDENQVRNDALGAERQRVKKINEFVAGFKIDGMKSKVADLARQAVESGTDFDSFRASVLDNWDQAQRVETVSPEIGMSKKDLKSYSLVKALRTLANKRPLDGIEKEASEAVAKLRREEPEGFFIPEDWSSRSLAEINDLNGSQLAAHRDHLQRTLTVGNFTSAGALVATNLLAGSLIELLRNKTVLLNSGVTALGGLVGNIAIPRQSGGATAYWLAEGASTTTSDQTFQQLGLTPKRLSAATGYDKQLLAQSSISVEALVRSDIAQVMAIKKDLAMISGLGAAGEPLGILNTSGVGTVTFGAAPTWAKVVSFETSLATNNADQTGTPIWVTSPAVRGAWKTTAKIGSTFPVFLWESDMVNGYRAFVTNQVAGDKVLFGVPSEIIDATWAGIDVVVDPYTAAANAQIKTYVNMWTDLALRHAPSWVVSTDSGAQ